MHSVFALEVLDRYLYSTWFTPTKQKSGRGRCSNTLISIFSYIYQHHKLSSDLIHTLCDVQMEWSEVCTVVQTLSEWREIWRRGLKNMYETVTSLVECSAARWVLSCRRSRNDARCGGVAVRVCMRPRRHLSAVQVVCTVVQTFSEWQEIWRRSLKNTRPWCHLFSAVQRCVYCRVDALDMAREWAA